ncbi:MAG TPA: hypothetical protein VF251_13915 [Pyrinomonadaceae bacterium]
MYCQACGMALTQQMRYCNRCGVQLVTPGEESAAKAAREKRLDEYLNGLFWITVFGLAFVFGGTVILKKLALNNWLILGYMVLSSVAFLINFALSLWGVARIHRQSKTDHVVGPATNTSELVQHEIVGLPPATPVGSVTENTTRSFDPVYVKRNQPE